MKQVKIYTNTGKFIVAKKINRNDICKCGSGKKAKKCCGYETKYYQK